ncbi:MAG: DUF4145 domain-containing protein [Beijerinckiaceae bacterium]
MKQVIPSVKETAFNCPHCGALTTQYWHSLIAKKNHPDHPRPFVVTHLDENQFDHIQDKTLKANITAKFRRMAEGYPHLGTEEKGSYGDEIVYNLNISDCYNCKKIAVWIFNRLIYPSFGEAPPANEDMPSEIRCDYDEASLILNFSPRGAAALIRLCIQKLCKHLGQTGNNLNVDIGNLVKMGLDTRVQKALDSVRVIGNNAVHPGQIDLRDNREIAESLFRLLNLIIERTISEPKHIDDVYESLPQSARDAIARRDDNA